MGVHWPRLERTHTGDTGRARAVSVLSWLLCTVRGILPSRPVSPGGAVPEGQTKALGTDAERWWVINAN